MSSTTPQKAKIIEDYCIFDAVWYSKKYPDVALSGLTAQEHYNRIGKYIGRDKYHRNHSIPDHFENIASEQWVKETEPFVPKQDVEIFTITDLVSAPPKDVDDCVVTPPSNWPWSRLNEEQISSVRNKLTQKYNVDFFQVPDNKSYSRERSPFHQMSEGECVEQYFIATNNNLHSLTLFLYTFMQKNSADVSVELFIMSPNENWHRIIYKTYRGEEIADGAAVHLWLEPEISHVVGQIFKIAITILRLPHSMMITPALGETNQLTLRGLDAGGGNRLSLSFSINQAPSRVSKKMFAYVSGCPGDAFRYRCLHIGEVIAGQGYGVDVFEPESHDWSTILANYKVVVLHRVPHDEYMEKFIGRARQQGVVTIFDTDDLVFDPSLVDQIDAYTSMDEEGKELYLSGLVRYNKTLSLCDYVTVSTERLRDEVKRLWPAKAISIIRNRVSKDMYNFAIAAMEVKRVPANEVVIAYFSGSRTHRKDFKTCEKALLDILAKHNNVKFLAVGHLSLSASFDRFSAQIKTIPFVAWESLSSIYHGVDINLAPLEYCSSFTESKSELKYLEAALLGIPTIGANLGAYKHTMEHGVDGLLCGTEDEWFAAMELLVSNPGVRARMGDAAKTKVMNQFTTFANGQLVQTAYKELLCKAQTQLKQKISVAFIMRAPIGKTGGGYKKIFILANYLKKYYDVKVYVEAIAHLSEMSDPEIAAYCEENFNFDRADVIVGPEKLTATDVVVATNWPTAPQIAASNVCRVKMYFVQDFEPEFYDTEDPAYTEALNTYFLGLQVVTIGNYLSQRLAAYGGWCRSIPFAIDKEFLGAEPIQRHSNGIPCSILFFARPNIPRRNFTEGVIALEMIARKYPQVRISLYGLDKHMVLPFSYDDLGLKTQDQLAEIMCITDIHLSFSLTNISTVIYEAMACGCACVEADVEPVRAMVKDGDDCLLTAPTAEGTYRILSKLIESPSLRSKLGRSGRQKALKLSEENMCEIFSQHINDSWMFTNESENSSIIDTLIA
jgi:glycosyltransferase involved in cell wall biosynthesis